MGNSPLHSTLVRVFVDGVAAGAGVRRANLRFEPALAASWVAQVQSGVALAMKQVEQVRRWQLAASRAPNVSAREVRNLTSQCTGPGLAAASSASKWACSVALRKRMPGPVTASVRSHKGHRHAHA